MKYCYFYYIYIYNIYITYITYTQKMFIQFMKGITWDMTFWIWREKGGLCQWTVCVKSSLCSFSVCFSHYLLHWDQCYPPAVSVCVCVCLGGRTLDNSSCYALNLHTHVHTKAYTLLCCLGVVMDHRHKTLDQRHSKAMLIHSGWPTQANCNSQD